MNTVRKHMYHFSFRCNIFVFCFVSLCVLMILSAVHTDSRAEEIILKENAWNYVDVSLDASRGIPENADGRLALIRENGVLRVATEPYFPPHEYIDETLSGQDQYVGADMDLARLIAQRMGVELEIVPMAFSEVLDAVASGDCDLAVAALSYTPSRASSVEFSKGYHYAGSGQGHGIMVRADELDQFPDLDSLKDRVLAAQRGSLQESLAVDHIQYYLEFRRLPSVEDIYAALKDGSVDAAVVELENAEAWLKGNPDSGLAILPDIRFTLAAEADGDRVAAKKGELQLVAFINGVIDEVLSSGQYEAWFDEHSSKMSK